MRTKNIWKSLLMSAALLVSGAMVSCEDAGDETPSNFDAEISTSIGSTKVKVQAGDELKFTVTANTDWTAAVKGDTDIVALSKSAGRSGETEVVATISGSAVEKQSATVTFTAMGYIMGFESPATAIVEFTVSGDPSAVTALVTSIDDLKAGTYYLAAYSEAYDNSGNVTTFAPYSYHAWTGATKDTTTDNGVNTDLITVQYQYDEAAQTLTRKPGASGDAAEVEFIEAGENTYYIQCGGKYLYAKSSANRQLGLSDQPAEWVATDFAKGGILLSNNGASLVTAGATSNLLRSYGSPASRDYGVVLFTASEVQLAGGGDVQTPTEYKAVTVAEFNAAAESNTEVYELVGTVSGSINTTYGNFDLVDETGSVYVYGLTKSYLGYGSSNDQSYSQLGISSGDKIKIRGYRGSYNGKIEVMYAWFIEHLGKGEVPEQPSVPGTGFKSDSQFVCSSDDSATSSYSLKESTFNGEAATGFKLGTGSKTGTFTSTAVGVTGDYTLSLYGVAWNKAEGTLKVSVNGGGSVEGTDTFDLVSNSGASGNAPFTITVTESDLYTIWLKDLTPTSTITFETVGTAYRVVVAGIHLTEGHTSGGGTTEPEPDPTPDYTHKGTAEDPFNIADAIAKAKETGTTATSEQYYVKGRISAIKYTFSAQYGTATFDMADESSSDIFTAYSVKYFDNAKWVDGDTQVEIGDEVTVCGSIINYSGNTPEIAQNTGYLVELNGNKGGNGGGTTEPEPTPDGVKVISVADFNAAAESQTQVYQLTGTVSNITNDLYGNFDLVDETGSVYVYGLSTGEQKWNDKTDQTFGSMGITAGDKIKINGYRGSYNGKIEVMYAWLVEIVEKGSTEPEQPGTGTDPVEPTPTPDGAKVDILNQSWSGVTGTTYTALSDTKGSASNAVYTGMCAGDKNSIQLRSATDKNYSGIVTKTSGGKVLKVYVKWVGDTAAARVLDVYGKNEAYTAAEDLYNGATQGTKIASFTKSEGDKEITIEGDYSFIGFRSNSGALYLDEVQITWVE